MRRRSSIIWKISHDELQQALDESHSIVKVIQILGLNGYSGNHRTLKKRFEEEEFDFTKFEKNKKKEHSERFKKIGKLYKKPDSEVFCKNSTYVNNKSLKERLIKDHNWEYKCSECGVGDIYNDKPLSLQLDHINGVNCDNRFENLRFLCPNCHSQTETFSGKKTKLPPKKYYCKCGNEKSKQGVQCRSCKASSQFSIDWPDNDILSNLVSSLPMVKVAEKIGCSDTAVRKRCLKVGIEF